MRIPISKADRFRILTRDNYACQYCGKKAPDVVLEIDHKTPVSKGGDNAIDNLVTSCFDCNRGKGANTVEANIKTISDKSDFGLIFAAAAENLGRSDREKAFYKKLLITAYTSFHTVCASDLISEIIRCTDMDAARRNIFYMVFAELSNRIDVESEEE